MSGTLEHALRQKLPDYMVPAQFVVIPDIPASPNGKTDRQKLKNLASLPKLKIEITPPRNSVEEMISEIWSELLEEEQRLAFTRIFFVSVAIPCLQPGWHPESGRFGTSRCR